MSRSDRNQQAPAVSQRPYASETEIRAMYDKAAAHHARAAEHEGNAARLLQAAEQAAAEQVRLVNEKADQYVQQAQATAAEMVRQAKAQADEDRREAQQKAAADVQEAKARVAMIRADRDEETKGERFWVGLAADEAGRAGLPPVPPEPPAQPETPPAPFDPLAGSPMVTRQDQMPPVTQDGAQS